jgi:integrase
MKAKTELTELDVRNAPPGARLADAACPGLLFVNGKARKAWTLRWSHTAAGLTKAHSVVIGFWPAMSLQAARGAAELRRAEIAMGHDPAAERQQRREARTSVRKKTKAPTLAEVWTKFMDEQLVVSRKDHGAVADRQVRKDCQMLLAKRVDQITVDLVTAALRPVIERAPSMAASVKAHLGWAWEHAQEADFIEAAARNPFRVAFKRAKALQQRVRTEKFRAEHWKKFFAWLPDSGLSRQMQAVLMLQAATGARAGEILQLQREGIVHHADGSATWQGKFKTDGLRVLYFAPPAARLLLELANERGGKWLFPKRAHAGDAAMDTMALVTAINSVRHTCPVNLAAEGQGRDWSSHTLRRSVRSGLTYERICDTDTAERVLGHEISGVRASYDSADNHLPAIRAALDHWIDLLQRWGAPFPAAGLRNAKDTAKAAS